MSFGFQVFNTDGLSDFSLTGRSPRFYATGIFNVPTTGNVVISGRNLYQFDLSVPDITNPSEWWIVYLPITSAAYSYWFGQVYSTSINIGSISLLVDVPPVMVPIRYVLLKLL